MKSKTMLSMHLLLFFLFALLLSVDKSFAQRKGSTSGYKSYKGAKVIDGDTYRYKGKSYRIQGYNAPEIGQPGSKRATTSLQKRLNSGKYKYKPVAKDVYGRTIVKEQKNKMDSGKPQKRK